jgi:hypothetical protein
MGIATLIVEPSLMDAKPTMCIAIPNAFQ